MHDVPLRIVPHRDREPAISVAVAIVDETLRDQAYNALLEGDAAFAPCLTNQEWLLNGHPAWAQAVVVADDISRNAGIEALTGLRASRPSVRIVVIAPSIDWAGAERAIRAGADGLVLESNVGTTLSVTVHAACVGQVTVPREASPPERAALSYREKQLLGMVVMGFSNRDIAKRLHLTESTVKSHLSSGFRKLGVRSRAAASALILDPNNGLGTGILTISGNEREAARSRMG